MALDAVRLGIFFKMSVQEDIDTFRGSCAFLQSLLQGAEWPEKSRDKINEYIKAFDTVNRYGQDDEDLRPGKEEIDHAAAILSDSGKFLSSDAGDGRTVYQCMMDQYRNVLKQRYPAARPEKLEKRFQDYSKAAERDLQKTFSLLDIDCDLQAAKQLKAKANDPLEQAPIEQDPLGQAPIENPPPAEPLFVPKPFVRKTAAKWIEDIRKPENLFKQVDGAMTVDYDQVVKIMAARHYAESVRGDAAKLDSTSIKDKELDKRADQLKTLPHFKDFLESLKDPAKQRKMLSAIGKGHCGGLDDMFTAYLKELPAGQLENVPELKRYMPTAKDRIEALKKQTGRLGAVPGDADAQREHFRKKAAAAAEIVQLRNLVQAERKKKSTLDVKIPVDSQNSLKAGVNTLIRDPAALKALGSDDTQELLQKGHGGEMTILLRDKMREAQKTGNHRMGREARRILKHNTYEGRMEELREEAGKIPALLDSQNEIEAEETIERSKEMLGQYFAYNSDFYDKQGRIPNAEELLRKDIPWEKMNKRFKNVSNLDTYKLFADNMDLEGTRKIMKEMSETEQQAFFTRRAEQYNQYKKNEQDEIRKQEAFEKYMEKRNNGKHLIDFEEDNVQEIGGGGIGL